MRNSSTHVQKQLGSLAFPVPVSHILVCELWFCVYETPFKAEAWLPGDPTVQEKAAAAAAAVFAGSASAATAPAAPLVGCFTELRADQPGEESAARPPSSLTSPSIPAHSPACTCTVQSPEGSELMFFLVSGHPWRQSLLAAPVSRLQAPVHLVRAEAEIASLT